MFFSFPTSLTQVKQSPHRVPALNSQVPRAGHEGHPGRGEPVDEGGPGEGVSRRDDPARAGQPLPLLEDHHGRLHHALAGRTVSHVLAADLDSDLPVEHILGVIEACVTVADVTITVSLH